MCMSRRLFIILLFFLSFSLQGQVLTINDSTQRHNLEDIAVAFKDSERKLTIDHILVSNQIPFKPISHFNIGISYSNYWLKFTLRNTTNTDKKLFLALESVVNDSLILYKIEDQKVVQTTIMGETLPFSARKIKYRTPIFEIILGPNEQSNFYLKSVGNGQPMNLTATVQDSEGFHDWDVSKMFFLGLVYGVLALVIIFNFSFFLVTKEKIYVIFSVQTFFSTLGITYFDAFVYQYVFPNSGYWSNQTIAISMCFTFIFNNRFISDFFNLEKLAPWASKTFRYTTFLIYLILIFSFVHPWGFNTFVLTMTALTSLIALLLFVSILAAKRQGFASYLFGLLATICLIIFGSVFQLHIMGLVPDNFFTHHSMHIAVATQAVFLALAVNDKFRIIREENIHFQVQLVEAMNQYSQNLISNIEGERQRLASDIHDGLGQHLLVIRNRILMSLKKKMNASKHEETLGYLLDITTDALEDTRAMSHNLRPPILNTMGLTVAIQSLVSKMMESSLVNINLEMTSSIDGLVSKELEINVYRILQECFHNTFKHASSTNIEIKIQKLTDELRIEFEDNGIGFNQNTVKLGQGLLGIKERVSLMKGTVLIESEDHKGSKIIIKIPIKK